MHNVLSVKETANGKKNIEEDLGYKNIGNGHCIPQSYCRDVVRLIVKPENKESNCVFYKIVIVRAAK